MIKIIKENHRNFIFVVIGSFMFACGTSLFITPIHLFSGGVMGVSQVTRTLLANAGILFPFEISGVLNALLNIPLLILAYRSISKRFFYLTLISVFSQMLFFTIIPIVNLPIIDDILASCIVGGSIAGFGVGLVLRARGSAGGIDILGVWLTQKSANFSVGKLSIIVNAFLFTICAILFDVETAIYSTIFLIVFSVVVDKVHYQNINMTAMIFTKNTKVKDCIIYDMHRGVTFWQGIGGYTNKDTYIMVTAISKYEISLLKNKIKKIDSEAFIIFTEGLSVSGNFEKRL